MDILRKAKTAGVLFLLFFIWSINAQAEENSFPMPEVIAPNVAFWTNVYAQYDSSQGIVHDSWDMEIVYDIIPLLPYDTPGVTKINRKRMKRAKKKYSDILKRLAANPHTTDKACRRVAELFKDASDARQFAVASRRVRCQIGQKDRFQAGLIRSGAYLDQFRAIFKRRGLPEDLAFLPHVESSFNPNAYSKFGAAGVWQFTRSTGRRFMSVGYELDERRDPILATYAAAALLKENYEKLGSWPLAITAYNHGANGMQRAQNKHGGYAQVYSNYRGRAFKFASRNFYSEFLAARHVAANAQNYFGNLQLDRPVPIHVVTLEGYAGFEDICDHFKVAPADLRKMNPALRKPVFDGQKFVPKGYALRLPAHVSQSLLSVVPDTIYKSEQKRSRFYTVQRGDTAGRIARIHKVRLSDLVLANNLDRRATIYPRQTLRIPGIDEPIRKPSTPEVPQSDIVVASAEESEASDETVPMEAAEAPAPNQTYAQPILASLIPLPAPVDQKPETDLEPDASQAANEQIVTMDVGFQRTFHINGQPAGELQVEVEETLGHYAEWANVRTQQIRRLNGLRFGSALKLHKKIKIPLNHVDAQTFEQNRYEYHKRLQEDFYAVYRIGELRTYRVERGDNYWNLCREKFQIPMWLLKHCNPDVNLAALRFHQKIVIPTIEKASIDDANPGIEQEDDVNTESSETDEETSKLSLPEKKASL